MTVSNVGPLPNHIARSISREELAALPISQYEGDVRLVETAHDLERAFDDLRSEQVVGFDTETRPSFRRGEYHPPSLIQIATAHAVYLFRLRAEADVEIPTDLVANPEVLKVGIALANDIRALKALRPFEERSILDLGEVAKRCGVGQTGVRGLAGIFLSVRIPKGTKTSNWAAKRLTDVQIRYAATDAWICRKLYLRFKSLGMISE
jgi:ribonuclease D